MPRNQAIKRPSAKQVRACLRYNKRSGIFTWIAPTYRNPQIVGRVAGYKNWAGYIYIKCMGRLYPAHVLAWVYVKGKWPQFHLDHKNGQRDDNKWSNIRSGAGSRNSQNSAPKRGTRFGLKGIFLANDTFRRKPFAARIGVRGKYVNLGHFSTPEKAHAAYCIAAKKYYGEYARLK